MVVAVVAICMVLLFFLNVPIYISMLCAVVIYFVSVDANIMIMIQKMMGGVQKTSLLAIPFFIMSGICMNYTGITRRMMNFAEKCTGHLPGGLAQVNVLLSTLMGGLSGSCIADAAMQSKILYPEMVKRNYGKGFSAAVTAVGPAAVLLVIVLGFGHENTPAGLPSGSKKASYSIPHATHTALLILISVFSYSI